MGFFCCLLKNKYDNRRGSSSKRGYDYKWQQAREGYLKKHPHCVQHLKINIVERAKIVDHIIPPKLKEAKASGNPKLIAAAKKLFWDKNNWQSLCKLCHDSWKQRLEKSGIDIGCGANGVPFDKNHHWNTAP